MKTRFIGFEDAGKRPYGYVQKPGLLVVHCVVCKDALPSHLWVFVGERETTKAGLKTRIHNDIPGFLAMVKKVYGREFTVIKIM